MNLPLTITPQEHGAAHVLFDLCDVLERLIEAGDSECLDQPGFESSCECATHVRVRTVSEEAKALLTQMRRA